MTTYVQASIRPCCCCVYKYAHNVVSKAEPKQYECLLTGWVSMQQSACKQFVSYAYDLQHHVLF